MKYDLAVYISITLALVQIVKDFIPNRFIPILSVAIGLIFGLLVAHYDVVQAFMIGLSACGAYRGIKVLVNNE